QAQVGTISHLACGQAEGHLVGLTALDAFTGLECDDHGRFARDEKGGMVRSERLKESLAMPKLFQPGKPICV
ncbi:MAG: hypothetical protein ORN49_05325, partial [Rhodobacteraceae bacterium]|nr:hypothetical protein [Paracoccaceae bacterium]